MAGDFHLQTEGLGGYKSVKEAIEAAWRYFESNAARVAPGMHISTKDYLLFFNDLQGKGPTDEASLAEFVGLCSAAANRPVAPALAIPGVLRMSGTMDELRDLEDVMRVARNAGARRILLPMSAIRDLQGIARSSSVPSAPTSTRTATRRPRPRRRLNCRSFAHPIMRFAVRDDA